MRMALQISAAGMSAMLLASCGSSESTAGNHPSGTGPFDSRGNYIEDWADNPSKWKRGGTVPSKPGESLVMNDIPVDSVPIPTAADTPEPGPVGTTAVVSRPTPVRTTTTTTTTTSRPKPKPVAAKPKPAPKKPAVTRYTVRRGDTLSAIASRNKTSVSALQRANGIKGSLIQVGKVLVIPR